MVLHLMLKLFGVDPVFLRLPTLLAGIASLILAYLITFKFTRNRVIALGVTLLLAISTKHIYYSANARGYILIILFSQVVIYWMLAIHQSDQSSESIEPTVRCGIAELLVLLLAFVLGTWTIPTFAMLQGSLLFFLAIHLIIRKIQGYPVLDSTTAKVILIILISLIIFYIQYFILIPGDVLLLSTTRAPLNLPAHFIRDILVNLFHPHESALPILLGLAILGMACAYKNSRTATLFLLNIVVLPPIFLLLTFKAGIINNLPTPRVFLYFQPIVYLFVTIALYSAIIYIAEIFNRRFKKPAWIFIAPNFIFIFTLLITGIPSAKTLYQTDIPERIQRDPFDAIHQFIKQSGPNDLFMASNQIHVAMFLYGAKEIRTKVDTIIQSGSLDNIYIIGSIVDGKPDIETVKEDGKTYYSIRGYNQIKTSFNRPNWKIPKDSLEIVWQKRNLTLFKIPASRIRKIFSLSDPKDLGNWQYKGKANAIEISKIKNENYSHWGLFLQDKATLFSPPLNLKSDPSLTIKFMVTQNLEQPIIYYLNTGLNNDMAEYKPAWLGNAWILDHPYSAKIYNQPTLPWIFISDIPPDREVIHPQIPHDKLPQILWGLHSFVIEGD